MERANGFDITPMCDRRTQVCVCECVCARACARVRPRERLRTYGACSCMFVRVHDGAQCIARLPVRVYNKRARARRDMLMRVCVCVCVCARVCVLSSQVNSGTPVAVAPAMWHVDPFCYGMYHVAPAMWRMSTCVRWLQTMWCLSTCGM